MSALRTYKFRAETIVDVFTWLMLCGKACPHTYTIAKSDTFPDVEVEYTTPVDGGLAEAMYRVSDGHEMIERHAPAADYTGERAERDYHRAGAGGVVAAIKILDH